MKLAQLQADFFEWVAGAEAIPPHAVAEVVNAGSLDPSTRVGIYAEMYWLRMRDVLREDFHQVRKAVGDEQFEVLVASYLQCHPSRHHSLGRLGHRFAEFLAGHEPPWLASVASLEWARGQAFVAPNGRTVDASALAAINEETLAHVHLQPSSSLRLLALDHDTAKAHRPHWVIVWRREHEVFHVEVREEEAQALTLLLADGGARLPSLCEPFTEPSQAFTAIASWVNEGMISSLRVMAEDQRLNQR